MQAIVITGTPGTGKTEFSKELAKVLGCEYVDLNDLFLKAKCYKSFDYERQSYVIDINRAKSLIKERFATGCFIFDSHISHLVVSKEFVKMCFVLRTSPYILERRLLSRGFDRQKVLENCSAEILDIILKEALDEYGIEKVCELDTTTTKVSELVSCAVKVVNGLERPKVGIVNWLKLVQEKGDLSHFFKN